MALSHDLLLFFVCCDFIFGIGKSSVHVRHRYCVAMQILAPWCVAVWHCCLYLRSRVFPAPEQTFSREKLRRDFLLKIENLYGLDESEFMHEEKLKAI